jgi:hypothetical protein
MSFVEDVNRYNNERRAEEGRQANVEHMVEMAQKAAADALIPKNAVKDAWDKRLERREQLKGIHKILGLISRE